MDDEYQQKSFYMSINAPVHSSHRMFSHRITTLFFGLLNLQYQHKIFSQYYYLWKIFAD